MGEVYNSRLNSKIHMSSDVIGRKWATFQLSIRVRQTNKIHLSKKSKTRLFSRKSIIFKLGIIKGTVQYSVPNNSVVKYCG